MNWVEVTVETTAIGADIVAQIFYEIQVPGVVIEGPEAVRRAEQESGARGDADHSLSDMEDTGTEDMIQVKAYIKSDAALHDKLQFVKERLRQLREQDFGLDPGTLRMSLENVRAEDWTNNWKKYFKPIKVSDRIVIKPSWEQYEKKPGERVLEMDPGMAFGTGTHETTRLCIRMIERYLQPGNTVVDIGCGTGVLAISSVLLGAARAVAVDLDENAVRTAKENIKRNRVEDRVEVRKSNLLDGVRGQFDLAVSNILAETIRKLTTSIRGVLKPGGIFLASGLLLDNLQEVTDAMQTAGLDVIGKDAMGDWVAVACRRSA
jgi:ribosomal protein L11 methyltransferase